MSGVFDGERHMAHFDLQGGALCDRFSRSKMVTMDYFKATCQDCRSTYRDEMQKHEFDPVKKDIHRIMFEQNCSLEMATHVHNARTKMEQKLMALQAAKNTNRS